MRIGITQRVEVIAAYGERRDCLDQQWFRLLEAMGLTAVPVPNSLTDPDSWLAAMALDGFVLSGGNDLAQLPDAANAAPERDATERRILDYAADKSLPVLGVCRGLQMINVHLGGQLAPVRGHAAVRHDLQPGDTSSRFAGIQRVNSFHNWGVPREGLAQSLTPALLSEEGDVEAFEHDRLPWLGMMWHPERETPFMEADLRIIQTLFRGNECKL
ncbi:MAG: gamma-glutamyl-gamma-aminobutyrate hydrolase family protein [Marinobacter sp.]|nr:gamma-glutamyl-gamma-aminobutyrate hydrolase family protein [Marinobacter sp.]